MRGPSFAETWLCYRLAFHAGSPVCICISMAIPMKLPMAVPASPTWPHGLYLSRGSQAELVLFLVFGARTSFCHTTWRYSCDKINT